MLGSERIHSLDASDSDSRFNSHVNIDVRTGVRHNSVTFRSVVPCSAPPYCRQSRISKEDIVSSPRNVSCKYIHTTTKQLCTKSGIVPNQSNPHSEQEELQYKASLYHE